MSPKYINLALMMVSFFLIINILITLLFNSSIIPSQSIKRIVNGFTYSLDTSPAKCIFNSSGIVGDIPIDRCCLQIQSQLSCDPINSTEFNFKCYTSKTSERFYLINKKTLNYCENVGFYVNTE